MFALASDPTFVAGIAVGAVGATLLVAAHVQSSMLRRRVASGIGTAVVDRTTGLYSVDVATGCVEAAANRAARLGRDLDVWIGAAIDRATLDVAGRELALALPAGLAGVRVDDRHAVVVGCTGSDGIDLLTGDLTWHRRTIVSTAGARAVAADAMAEVAKVRGA